MREREGGGPGVRAFAVDDAGVNSSPMGCKRLGGA
jgi:hypothetical protein